MPPTTRLQRTRAEGGRCAATLSSCARFSHIAALASGRRRGCALDAMSGDADPPDAGTTPAPIVGLLHRYSFTGSSSMACLDADATFYTSQ